MLSALTTPALARDHANRYDPAYQVASATLTATGQIGDTVYTALRNRRTARIVHVITHTLTATGANALTHSTDLETEANDADGIYRAVHGDYAIVAQDTDPTDATLTPTYRTISPTFPITIVSPSALRDEWLRGIQLRDETTLRGATTLPGATVPDTDARDIEPGRYILTHDAAADTLAWWGGNPEPYNPSAAPLTLTLYNATNDAALDLAIIPATIATQPSADYALTLRYAPYTDAILLRTIQRATDELQAIIGRTGIEPRQHCTKQLAATFPYADDPTLPPRRLHRADMESRTLPAIESGVRQIQKIHDVQGFLGNTPTLTLPSTWATTTAAQSTLVHFLPISGAIVVRQPAPVPYWSLVQTFGSGGDVPGYWHLALTAGLPNLWNDTGALVREYVARSVALRLTLQASRANLGGYQGESFARDGISVQRQGTLGQGGTYGQEAASHQEWLTATRKTLLQRIVGTRGAR